MDYWINPGHWGIVDLPTYIFGTIAIVLLPGPNSLFVLTTSSQNGWRPANWAALGIVVGDSVLMLAIVFGAASLLQSSPTLFTVIRFLGALYLLWLGWGLTKISWQRYQGQNLIQDQSIARRLMHIHPFWAALILSLTNPKAIFFFLSFFTQFVDPSFTNPALSFLYLAIFLQIISITYLSVLIWAGQALVQTFTRRPMWAAALWLVVGLMFIAFAVRLAISDQVLL